MSVAAFMDNNSNQEIKFAQIDETNLFIGNLCKPLKTLDPHTRVSDASQIIYRGNISVDVDNDN